MVVRPQRKFAAKPPDLPDNVVVEEPQEPEPERVIPPEPYVSIVREPINHLIDEMAFKGIHDHPKRAVPKRNQKVVRIVLERISPPKSPADTQNLVLRNRTIDKTAAKLNTRKDSKVKRLQPTPRKFSESKFNRDDHIPLTYLAQNKSFKNKRNNRADLSINKNSIKKKTRSSIQKNNSNKQVAMASIVDVDEPSTSNVNLQDDDFHMECADPSTSNVTLQNDDFHVECADPSTSNVTLQNDDFHMECADPSTSNVTLQNDDFHVECADPSTSNVTLQNDDFHMECADPSISNVTLQNDDFHVGCADPSTSNVTLQNDDHHIECAEPSTSNVTSQNDDDLNADNGFPLPRISKTVTVDVVVTSFGSDTDFKDEDFDIVEEKIEGLLETCSGAEQNMDNSHLPDALSDVAERNISDSHPPDPLSGVAELNVDASHLPNALSDVAEQNTDGSHLLDGLSGTADRNRSVEPPDAWVVFLSNIFDWTLESENAIVDVSERMTDKSVENSSHNNGDWANLSQARVQEWLSGQTVQSNQATQSQFKLPEPPRRRVKNPVQPPPPLSSIGSIRPVSISCKEKMLRQSCTAWKYAALGDIISKPEFIQSFCMECTRCEVMFDKNKLRRLSGPLPSGSLVDVYEFNSERDDDLDLQPFRKRRPLDKSLEHSQFKKNLLKISKQSSHIQKLKEVMTDKGQKILKLAVLMNADVNALSPNNPNIIDVITTLLECNAARMDTKKQPATAHGTSDLLVLSNPGLQSLRLRDPTRAVPNRRCSSDGSDTMLEALLGHDDYKAQFAQQNPEGFLITAPNFELSVDDLLKCPVEIAYDIQKKFPGVSLCGLKPHVSFKPVCVVNNPQANFNARNHYIQRMMKRWGVGTQELIAIRLVQEPKMQRSPLFEGIELDLVKLYHTVQNEKGIEACQKNVQKWEVVARKMKLHYTNKKAYSNLENSYLKYLLNYNALTSEERQKTLQKVDMCWRAREAKAKVRLQVPLWRQDYLRSGRSISDDEELSIYEKVCTEAEECVTSGRYCHLNNFKKMANQVIKTYFPKKVNPDPKEVEIQYWGIVTSANTHVCVHAGSVEATDHDVGFTRDTNDIYGKHSWNLKRLSVSPENLLSYLGPTPGVSSTTVHYGMLFSTSCWHMDPTSVHWIEYLHTGAPKIWYSVGANQAIKMRAAVKKICPFAVQNKEIWLPCDFAMIPPKLLRQYGVSVHRHVQHAGEYVIVYPNTYTACIDTGFNITEGVYFAPHDWIMSIDTIFQKLRDDAEPSLFSMEDLLISIVQNKDVSYALLQQASTQLVPLLHAELGYRTELINASIELLTPENALQQVFLEQNKRASRTSWHIQKGGECAYCRCHLHLSKVIGLTEGQTSLCARHGVLIMEHALKRKRQISNAYCIVFFTNAKIKAILTLMKQRLAKDAV